MKYWRTKMLMFQIIYSSSEFEWLKVPQLSIYCDLRDSLEPRNACKAVTSLRSCSGVGIMRTVIFVPSTGWLTRLAVICERPTYLWTW